MPIVLKVKMIELIMNDSKTWQVKRKGIADMRVHGCLNLFNMRLEVGYRNKDWITGIWGLLVSLQNWKHQKMQGLKNQQKNGGITETHGTMIHFSHLQSFCWILKLAEIKH